MRSTIHGAGRRLVVVGLLVATALGGLTVPAAAQVAPDPAPPTPTDEISASVAEQIEAIVDDKADRTPAERKVASDLLYAAAEADGGPAVAGAPDLESKAEVDDGRTDVDIAATVDDGLLDRIEALGGDVVASVPAFDAVRATLPVEAVTDLAADRRVRTIAPAGEAMTNAAPSGGATTASVGAGASQADVTHGADEVRATFGFDGAGVKVCALSDGIDSLGASQASGDLPAVDVLPGQAGSGDEGTAMLELIHDIAPAAELGFATAFGGQAQFAQNILDLRTDGCGVIVDDVTYFAEAAFQDDDVARAVSQVKADGAISFSSAGNSGNLADGTSGSWQGDFQDAGASASPLPAGLRVHGWGVGQPANVMTAGSNQRVALHWADPLGASANDYDLYVLNAAGTSVVASSSTDQTGTQDPYESVPAFANERIVVTKAAGAAERYLALYTNRGRLTHATAGATYGHNASVDAISTAATPAGEPATFYDPTSPSGPFPDQHSAADTSELFSSDGPSRSFFGPDGTPLTPGVFTSAGGIERNGVDITAADGATTTAPGFATFYGTSAAAPNAAAIAALALSADPTLTPDELEDAMQASAIDIELPGVDVTTGPGIAMAPALITELGLDTEPSIQLAGRTTAEVAGDGDAAVEPGEVFDIVQTIRNAGQGEATDVDVTLATTSSDATVRLVSAAPTTLAGQTEASATFRVRVSRDCECGATLPFTAGVTWSGGVVASRSTSFTVVVSGGVGPAATTPYTGPVVAIPDGGETPASATLTVGAGERIGDLTLTIGGSACSTAVGATTVGIDHTYVSDLTITLTSPAGTTVPLMTRRGGGGNNLCQTVFSDAATTPISSVASLQAPFTGSYRPETPLSAFDGEDPEGTWTLQAFDGEEADTGSIRAFSLGISPVTCDELANAAPTTTADLYSTAFETPLTVAAPGVLGNDADPTEDPLTAALVDDVDDGTLALAADGSFTYTPDDGFSGDDTFTYTASDGSLGSTATTVTITVGADPNVAPTGVADDYDTAYETTLTEPAPGVLGNDTDPDDGDVLTASLVEDADDGTLALAPDGSFTYTPDDGFSGDDTFTYRASDGRLASATTTVTITVGEKPNGAPVAVGDAYSTEFETTYTAVVPGVLGNDTDEDGDGLTATLAEDVDDGTLVLSPDGSFAYTPDDGFSGDDTFTYTASDGDLTSAAATVTITVGADPNAAPTALPDTYAVGFETTTTVAAPGVLGNDTDADEDPLTAALVADVAHGSLALAADGSFTYTPDDGFAGDDTFTYTASDGSLTTAPVTVTLEVRRSTDAFVAALYRDFLGRPVEADGLAFWGDRLLDGLDTRAQVARKISRSSEYAGIVTRRAYLTYLGRPGEAAGVAYWAERVRTGLSVTELPVHLMGSPEFAARAGGTPAGFVDALFQAVLDRAPTTEERAERVAALQRGTGRATIARLLHAGVESRRLRVATQYDLLLDRVPTTSERDAGVAFLATRDDRDLAVLLAGGDEYLAHAED